MIVVSETNDDLVDVAALKRHLENERILNQILRLVRKPHLLDVILDECLGLLLQTSWLAILPKGGVFLKEAGADRLLLVAERNLSKPLVTLCAKIEFGQCLCGRAAVAQRILHARCVDEQHDIRFEGMGPHGHYNVPIIGEGETLGVLVLYLPHGHERDPMEIEFLESVSEILSLVIQVKNHQENLNDLIAIRTLKLEEAKVTAELANKTKSTFLANASHELRTPLNAVIGFSEVLLQLESSGGETSMRHEYLSMIRDSGKQLNQTVTEILELSKVELGSIELSDEYFKVEDAVNSIVGIVEARGAAANIRIKCEVSCDVAEFWGDAIKFRQILICVVDNAIKFSPPDSQVDIVVRMDADAGCVIQITDTGSGIAEEDLDRVCEPFFRCGNNDGHIAGKGAGLGLAIAYQLTRAHGGTLEIDSAKGKGTTVSLLFPADRVGA